MREPIGCLERLSFQVAEWSFQQYLYIEANGCKRGQHVCNGGCSRLNVDSTIALRKSPRPPESRCRLGMQLGQKNNSIWPHDPRQLAGKRTYFCEVSECKTAGNQIT
jgi:hypothetical protein